MSALKIDLYSYMCSKMSLFLLLLILATVTYNQVHSYWVNLLQQIIITAKCHCCVFVALDHSIREVNY